MIYLLTPVSTPPEKDGWYDFIDISGEVKATSYYFMEGDWYESEDDAKINEHHDTLDVDGYYYLRPISEEKLREVMGLAWDACEAKEKEYREYPYGKRDPSTAFPERETSITNAIKALSNL